MNPSPRIRALLLLVALAWAVVGLAPRGRAAPAESGPVWRIQADNFRGAGGSREHGDLLNVRIENDSLVATSERGRWDNRRQVATLIGSVHLTDGSAVVTGDSLVYYRSTDRATIVGSVDAREGAFIGVADTAHVDRARGTAILLGKVILVDDRGTVEARRVDYDRESGIAVARGDVRAVDAESGSIVTGERMVHDASDSLIVVTGDPRLTSKDAGQKPMRVRAEEMRLYRGSGRAEALRDVRVFQGEVRANAARAVMEANGDRLVLTGSPVAWDPVGRISADTLIVHIADELVRRMEAHGNVRVVQAPTTGPKAGERTEAVGRHATAWFGDGVADSLLVEGDAVTTFTPSPADIAVGTGVNHARGDRIRLVLAGGEVTRVRLEGNASGRYWFESTEAAPPDTTDAPTPATLGLGDGEPGERVRPTRPGPPPVLDPVGGQPRPPRRPPSSSSSPDSVGAADVGVDSTRAVVAIADSTMTTDAIPDSTMTTDAIPDSIAIAGSPPDSTATAGAATARADTTEAPVRMLTASRFVAAELDSVAAPDSTKTDSLAWADLLQDLDEITPPDSLFPNGTDHVTYQGQVVEFETDTRNLRLIGEATLQYGEAQLRSQRVDFDTRQEMLTATGEPVLSDPGGTVFGVAMDYDVPSREGVVHHGYTEFEGGYYKGRRVKKLDDRTLLAQDCAYTTCDRIHDPHFHFQAPEMKIKIREKVVGRPVILHIANIPVMAVPYFLFPIEKGRRSGFLLPNVELGLSQRRGRFIRNFGYYWAASDYFDLTASADFYETRPRWIGYAQGRYKKRYSFDGQIYTAFGERYPDRNLPEGSQERSQQWELRARHSQTLGERSSLKIDANFLTSREFQRDQELGTDLEDQVDRILRSNAAYSTSWPWGSLNLTASRTEDLEATEGQRAITSTFPSASLSMSRRTLGRKASGSDPGFLPALSTVTYGYSFRADQVFTKDVGEPTERAFAARHDVSIADSRKLMGVISVGPRFSYSEYLFEEDERGDRWQRVGRWSAGASASTTLYGTLALGGDAFAFRHVMSPSASFSYQPEVRGGTFTETTITDGLFDEEGNPLPPDTLMVDRSRFQTVGGIGFGSASRSRTLSLQVSNRYQLKYRKGDEVRKIDELATWSASTAYSFDRDEEPWSDLSLSFRMSPLEAVRINARSSHDLYGEGMTSLSVSTDVSLSGTTAGRKPAGTAFLSRNEDLFWDRRDETFDDDEKTTSGQPWSLSLGHSYSRGRDASDFQSALRSNLSLTLTEKWRVTYSASADLREKELRTQSLTVYRDIHCWEASFQRDFLSSGGASYYFRIGVKDIPEIFYEQRD